MQACVSLLDSCSVTGAKNFLWFGICKSGWNAFSFSADRCLFFCGEMYEHSGRSPIPIDTSVIIFSFRLNFASKHWFYFKTSCFSRVFFGLLQKMCRENNLLLNVAGNWFTDVALSSAFNWFLGENMNRFFFFRAVFFFDLPLGQKYLARISSYCFEFSFQSFLVNERSRESRGRCNRLFRLLRYHFRSACISQTQLPSKLLVMFFTGTGFHCTWLKASATIDNFKSDRDSVSLSVKKKTEYQTKPEFIYFFLFRGTC